VCFCFSGLAGCKRDALPTELTAQNKRYYYINDWIM
jgi:hypothetical protein